MHEHETWRDDWTTGVPFSGAVWFGTVITQTRRALMIDYRARHDWLFRRTMARDDRLAPQWTKDERTMFRKWRADFMRPMNVEDDKKKRR